jgi:hypothetical protein
MTYSKLFFFALSTSGRSPARDSGFDATRLKEQASQIQKVSDQFELNKPAPQIVVDNQ